MENEYLEIEEIIIDRMSIMDSIKLLAPEIQQWILEEYGNYETFIESLSDKERVCDLFELISEKRLNLREQKVIFMRFGIVDGTPKTLEDISKRMGITRERVRQIESKCLRHGCHLHRVKKLKDYLDD